MSDETRKLLQSLLNQPTTTDQIGQAITSFQYRPTKSGDEKTALGISVGQVLASGILQGLSDRRKASQSRLATDVLPGLTMDPFGTERPDGLPVDIFEALRTDAILKQERRREEDALEEIKAQRERDMFVFKEGVSATSDREEALITALLQDVRNRSSAINDPDGFRQMVENLMNGSGSRAPEGIDDFDSAPEGIDALVAALEPPKSPIEKLIVAVGEPEAEEIDEDNRFGAPFGKSISEIRSETYAKVLNEFGDPAEAGRAAEDSVANFRKEQANMLDRANEIRTSIIELGGYLPGIEDAIDNTPFTGIPGQDMILLGTRLANMATSGKYEEILTNRAALDSLKARVTRIFRTVGEGQITEKEVANFVRGLPDVNKSAPENREIFRRLALFMEQNAQYADLIDQAAKSDRVINLAPYLREQRQSNIRLISVEEEAALGGFNASDYTGMSREEAVAAARKAGVIR